VGKKKKKNAAPVGSTGTQDQPVVSPFLTVPPGKGRKVAGAPLAQGLGGLTGFVPLIVGREGGRKKREGVAHPSRTLPRDSPRREANPPS